MRVICINDKEWGNSHRCPAVSEIVTVAKEYVDHEGDAVYEFVEYGKLACFEQRFFAPLSDIDETDLVTEEFNEKYCVPVNS